MSPVVHYNPDGPPDLHAQFSPSSAFRWLECAPSTLPPKEELQPSNYVDKQRNLGREAHLAFGEMVNLVASGRRHEIVLGSKIREKVYASIVRLGTMVFPLELADEIWIEQTLRSNNPKFFGTPDLVMKQGKDIVIVDLKFGKTVDRNDCKDQIICYATLLMSEGVIDFLKLSEGYQNVSSCLLMPNTDYELAFKAFDPYRLLENMNQIANRLDKYDAAGEEYKLEIAGNHCKFCNRRHECESYIPEVEER